MKLMQQIDILAYFGLFDLLFAYFGHGNTNPGLQRPVPISKIDFILGAIKRKRNCFDKQLKKVMKNFSS